MSATVNQVGADSKPRDRSCTASSQQGKEQVRQEETTGITSRLMAVCSECDHGARSAALPRLSRGLPLRAKSAARRKLLSPLSPLCRKRPSQTSDDENNTCNKLSTL